MASSSFQFEVENVEKSTEKLPTEPIKEALACFLNCKVEQSSIGEGQHVLGGIHYQGLLAAVYIAYSRHYPLVLTPDAIWITICQGVAHHMVIHGEKLRERFVSHKGQLELTHTVVPTPHGIDPESAMRGWSSQIREHVGAKLADALSCNFSTTTEIDRAVSHVAMMDAFRRYFKYRMVCICGLPSVTLEGTEEDWKLLRQKAEALEAFDLDWWLQDLRPILDHFVRARSGDIDLHHWQNICKLKDAYGGSIINGWINKLFPYIRSFINGPCSSRNPNVGGSDSTEGFSTLYAPTGLSRVPITVVDGATGMTQQKEIVAGFLGVEQDPGSLALRPLTGWAIRSAPKMDELIHRLMHEHAIAEIPTKSRSLFDNLRDLRREHDYDRFPEDLDRIYYEMREATIGGVDGSKSIRILPRKDIQPLKLGLGKPDAWFCFAELEDGRLIVADLNKTFRDPRPVKDWWSYDRNFCIVCVYDAENGTESSHVVAYSVRDWLEQSLDWAGAEKKEASYYWDTDGFQPVGNVVNPTAKYDKENARKRKVPGSEK